MKRRRLLIAKIVLATATGIFALSAAPAAVAAENRSEPRMPSDSCLLFNSNGEQAWQGQSSADLNALSSRLQTLVDENTDSAAGVALCSAYDGVAVFVTPDAYGLKSEIQDIASGASHSVVVYEVPAGLDALLAAGSALAMSGVSEDILGFGPDIYSGSLVVEVRPGSNLAELAAQAQQTIDQSGSPAVRVVTMYGAEGASHHSQRTIAEPRTHAAQLPTRRGYCAAGSLPVPVEMYRLPAVGQFTSGNVAYDGRLTCNPHSAPWAGKRQ